MVGRILAEDAVREMRHGRRIDDPQAFERDRVGSELVEQADPAAKQHENEVDE